MRALLRLQRLLLLPLCGVLASTASAETLDTSFSGDGRITSVETSLSLGGIAALPLPNGNVALVYKVAAADGLCADPYCIALDINNAAGVNLSSRVRPVGLSDVMAATVDSLGRIIVVGPTKPGPDGIDFGAVRFLQSGADDANFGSGGVTRVSIYSGADYPRDVAVDRNDRIVIVGSATVSPQDTDYAVVRLSAANGMPDTSFDNDGKRVMSFDLGSGLLLDAAHAVAVTDDFEILIAGIVYDAAISRFRIGLVRLLANGAYDTNFCNTSCNFNGGYTALNNGRRAYYFGSATAHSDEVWDMVAVPGGDFYLAGNTYSDNGAVKRAFIARFDYSGNWVREQGSDGLSGNAAFRSLRILGDQGQRLVAAGDSGPNQNFFILQAFDTATFATVPNYSNCLPGSSGLCLIGGTGLGDFGPDEAGALNVDANGRLLFIGTFTVTQNHVPQVLVARITNALAPEMFADGFE